MSIPRQAAPFVFQKRASCMCCFFRFSADRFKTSGRWQQLIITGKQIVIIYILRALYNLVSRVESRADLERRRSYGYIYPAIYELLPVINTSFVFELQKSKGVWNTVLLLACQKDRLSKIGSRRAAQSPDAPSSVTDASCRTQRGLMRVFWEMTFWRYASS